MLSSFLTISSLEEAEYWDILAHEDTAAGKVRVYWLSWTRTRLRYSNRWYTMKSTQSLYLGILSTFSDKYQQKIGTEQNDLLFTTIIFNPVFLKNSLQLVCLYFFVSTSWNTNKARSYIVMVILIFNDIILVKFLWRRLFRKNIIRNLRFFQCYTSRDE